MKIIAIIALLAVTASASLLEDKCFMNAAGKTVFTVANTLKEITSIENLDQYETILAQVAELKAAYTMCNIQDKIPNTSVSKILQNLGVGDLLLSKCTQDLGGFFLIVSSIIEDHSNIPTDIVGVIAAALMGKSAYGDCGQFIAFLKQL
ncbi:hypothetical protein TTHERM_00713220 (macronuclear) [Tetrahymena thermophila SB210]|uniref:Transmembrane protein n=1 Tax=Tetrahymena thermophila (strain SB210) TaxID=312017 RepID=Q24CX9_TETTS|nr:hypothetical protein TTHERM_00713220 [Tetrahymena thermophila SB210]EAS05629.1 hypothetical protein TTHERM_00713220 [Tetrahymena thermophila SB210]|eukprot:XP_001025874.1 hypothetical protein TTHERM_00713220 [Tetrahymena thermophila SB210]